MKQIKVVFEIDDETNEYFDESDIEYSINNLFRDFDSIVENDDTGIICGWHEGKEE